MLIYEIPTAEECWYVPVIYEIRPALLGNLSIFISSAYIKKIQPPAPECG